MNLEVPVGVPGHLLPAHLFEAGVHLVLRPLGGLGLAEELGERALTHRRGR
jgi:hypothetical protein